MSTPGACMNILNRRSETKYESFFNQNFQQLKQYCLNRRVRFIDDMFPPDKRAIGKDLLSPAQLSRVMWIRPSKLVANPSFIVEGVSRFDFGQGILGNCWFLASIGALTFQQPILAQVVPLDQTFDQEYCGIFHFRFWRFGRWIDVVIDDKLPTIDGRLIFVQSKNPNEFWPALLEKAYAKVCGSYADMNAGTPAEALVDFTGGVHICVQLSDPPSNLWELMCRAGKAGSLMGCGTDGEISTNTVLPNGLVQGHAYTVTGVKQVRSQETKVDLVRLWNPWGRGEWNGDWSDSSPLWDTVSAEDRETCHRMQDNGEFWMNLGDFCRFYSDLDICCLCPDFLDGSSSCHWKSFRYDGRWVEGISAGGCLNNIDSFWINPQYRVKVDKLLGGCSSSSGEKTMLVSLMQKPDKRNRRLVQYRYIGFTVFEVTDEFKSHKGKLPAVFFRTNTPVAQTKAHMNNREVMKMLPLPPGDYAVVLSTFNPDENASFLLTILSKAETHIHENSEGHDHEEGEEEPNIPDDNGTDDSSETSLFDKYSNEHEELGAEQLQKLLNDNVQKGGFSEDACRSMVALTDCSGHVRRGNQPWWFQGFQFILAPPRDVKQQFKALIFHQTSVTGKLSRREFSRLWRKIVKYKDIFSRGDVSQTGTLSLRELRNAVWASGHTMSDDVLNLMAVRYGSASGVITLGNFIALILRFECMNKIFSQLSEGPSMTLRKAEWMYLYMYS